MIVRNEAAIIERCCRAAAPHVDCYVICDTGSTDDTVEIVQRVFAEAGIPGEIHHTTFRNFSQARNVALDAARASSLDFDYLLLCDADMELEVTDPNWTTQLVGPTYAVTQRTTLGSLEYANLRLLARQHPARYVGATHEYLDVGNVERPVLEGLRFLDHAAGSSRTEKTERDIRLLTTELEGDPDNPRAVFYLANSYLDLGRLEEAEAQYHRRLALGGYPDERYIARYHLGIIRRRQGDDAGLWRQMLLAYDAFPSRAEPLHELARHAQSEDRHHLALAMASLGLTVPKPDNGLFVQADVYEWRLADIAAVALYWTGRADEALAINERILPLVPDADRQRIVDNIAWCRGKAPRT